MNDLPSHRTPVCPAAARQRRGAVGLRAALGAFLLCAFAQAQDPSLDRLVAGDAAQLLQHSDPIVRGEAAIIAATAGGVANQDALLAMASEPDDEARQRAILALGVLGTPAAVQFLQLRLQDHGTRSGEDGPVLAWALGSMSPRQAGEAQTEVLTQIVQGSFRRQRDTMLGLLLGLSLHTERNNQAALQRLLANEANRDPEVRALLMHLLLPHSAPDLRQLRRQLERGCDAERDSVLRWLAQEPKIDDTLLPLLERIAVRATDGGERARALAALTRARHLPTLELAARALRSDHPLEAGQALRSMLTLGGTRLQQALEERVRSETDPVRKQALLAHFDAPPSPELLTEVARVAKDGGQPFALRATAAVMMSRAAPERSAAILCDLFRSTSDDSTLPTLASAIVRLGGEPQPLSRLLEGSSDLRQHPERWQALLRAGHPEALRQALQRFGEDEAPSNLLRTTLLSWRLAMVTPAPRWRSQALPKPLRALLPE